MKFFEFFDKLDKVTIEERHKNLIPVNRPRVEKVNKIDDIKQYKRNYYIHNIEIYRERNREYRQRKKAEKKAQGLVNGDGIGC